MATPITDPLFWTIEEFGRATKLSDKTVRRHIKAGKIPAWQPGGPGTRILIPASCLGSSFVPPVPASDSSTASDSNLKKEKLPGMTPRWKQS
jgi:excisionase family DNA binding protein